MDDGRKVMTKERGRGCILFPIHGKISKKFMGSTITSSYVIDEMALFSEFNSPRRLHKTLKIKLYDI